MSSAQKAPRISQLAKVLVAIFVIQFIGFAFLMYRMSSGELGVMFVAWLSIEVSIAIALMLLALEATKTTRRIDRKTQNLARMIVRTREDIHGASVTRLTGADVPLLWTNPYMLSAESLHICLGKVVGHENVTVVECGSGISSHAFGYALRNNGSGKVYSLEHEKEYADITRQYIARSGLSDWVEVVYAPLVSYELDGNMYHWYDISGLPAEINIDFVLVDGPPGSSQDLARYPALPMLADKLSSKASIYIDDYGRKDEKAIVQKWLKKYPNYQLEEYLWVHKGGAMLSRS